MAAVKNHVAGQRYVVAGLVMLSALLLILSPYRETLEIIRSYDYWLAVILIGVSEVLFIGGIIVMALAVGHDLGLNPVKWRGQLKSVIQKVTEDRVFWVGFWVNFAGAVGTTLVIATLVVLVLPWQGWGIAAIGSLDLVVTVALRKEILRLKSVAS